MGHWLAHKLGLYEGQVITWWRDNKLMVGFMCNKCGRIDGEHQSLFRITM